VTCHIVSDVPCGLPVPIRALIDEGGADLLWSMEISFQIANPEFMSDRRTGRAQGNSLHLFQQTAVVHSTPDSDLEFPLGKSAGIAAR